LRLQLCDFLVTLVLAVPREVPEKYKGKFDFNAVCINEAPSDMWRVQSSGWDQVLFRSARMSVAAV
jgi:hypothetical protein